MVKEKALTASEEALLDVLEAEENFKIAEQNFNYASPDYVGIAIQEYNIAKEKRDIEHKRLREMCLKEGELPKRGFIYQEY